MIDITCDVTRAVKESSFTDGMALVTSPHTTAGITVNENADPDVQKDILAELSRIVPFDGNYRHFEGNSAAHIKTLMTGISALIPVSHGNLVLGRWQSLFFCEFDGPRNREYSLQLIGQSE